MCNVQEQSEMFSHKLKVQVQKILNVMYLHFVGQAHNNT